ncbi:class I glutamine amidotransferase-like protein [Cercophora newfieldiana]|uniref:Class I glutamine amidotransferase-like protein n=1 Tax=Cercophora newfieldiana TaxID=92897 RepID=A0AA39YEP9_9PEZI|nr:class I glutamine amidotransferase-like protein [Cercophora newfieldiana]
MKTSLVPALAVLAHWSQLSLAQDYPFTEEQKQNANRTLSVGYVVYHGYTILDVFGPLQFLADLSWPFSIELSVIAKETGAIHSRPPAHHGPDGMPMDMSHMIDAQIVATHTFVTAPPLDILIVTGGIGDLTLQEQNDTSVEEFIASRFPTTRHVLSVCSGAGFLARAGVLEGLRATATKGSWAHVTRHGKNVTWVPSARWVHDGKVWTSSGVSAGMDMMVAFLRHVYGDPVVNTSVNNVEYAPHVDPSWDPFSVVHKVPGANMSMAMKELVGPLEVYP